MRFISRLFDRQAQAEAALRNELALRDVALENMPLEVLRSVAAHCVSVAYGPVSRLDRLSGGPKGPFAGQARLQSQAAYAARMMAAVASNEIELDTLRSRSPALYQAIASGVVAHSFPERLEQGE